MIDLAVPDPSPVVVAFFKAHDYGSPIDRVKAMLNGSDYSRCEIVLGRRRGTYIFECAGSTWADRGARIVSEPLDPRQWECYSIPKTDARYVRAWFDLREQFRRRGNLSMLIRRLSGRSSALPAPAACASAMGWGFATEFGMPHLAAACRIVGEPVPLQHAFH